MANYDTQSLLLSIALLALIEVKADWIFMSEITKLLLIEYLFCLNNGIGVGHAETDALCFLGNYRSVFVPANVPLMSKYYMFVFCSVHNDWASRPY